MSARAKVIAEVLRLLKLEVPPNTSMLVPVGSGGVVSEVEWSGVRW